MPLKRYGVLKGRAIAAVPETDDDSPHYQVQVNANGMRFRIAVNVKSAADAASELQYLVNSDFQHPLTQQLPALAVGVTPIPSQPGGIALDYIRGNLFTMSEMRPLPHNIPGPANDLNELLDDHIQRAIHDPDASIYAFGERWGPEVGTPDKVFHFNPGNGIHDIHMNQGNDARFKGDDGVWQDGGLLLHFPTANRWVGIFLKFQSQAIHTDDRTGHRIDQVIDDGDVQTVDKVIRIVAAMINPVGGDPEVETVTLLNASPHTINLSGWAITDRMKRKHALTGTLASGATLQIQLAKPVQLGNKSGLITLLNAEGLKVDGVAYTNAQTANEGWTTVF